MGRREEILTTTCQLLETQGYHATGVNEILDASGAPRGSLYYYFPDGKEGLAVQAIEQSGARIAARIDSALAQYDDIAVAVHEFITTVAAHVAAADYTVGAPITAVALEAASTSERLNAACAAVYRTWQVTFAKHLAAAGYPIEQATAIATLIIAVLEGATLLARTERSTRPLHMAADQIATLLRLTLPG